ncbi:unnamed protein product [Calicophoron daubneyi]
MLTDNEEAFYEACGKDLGRCKLETMAADLAPTKMEANTILAKMDEWLSDEKVSRSFLSLMDTPYVQRQPYGLVLVIGAWNYPVVLTLGPAIGAIAAGNTVLLKPSEHSLATATLIANLVPKYIDSRICQVFCGDEDASKNMMDSVRFDYVFYTGGPTVGRSVYMAAAKNLTPVTLELGGKCPVFVDSNVNVEMAAKRIIWSKIFNAGQTCVAPDYVICHTDVFDELSVAIGKVLEKFLGPDPRSSPDYARIINLRHFRRLVTLLKNSEGTILYGGDSSEDDLFISPTVVKDVPADDTLMSEEIFGPILPIVTVDLVADAVQIINKGEKSLAIYVFTNDQSVFDEFKLRTSSGSLSQNNCLSHFLLSELPFGGVGHSGIGRYHGKYSIDTFSHQRAILLKSTNDVVNNSILYYPYTERQFRWISWALSKSENRSCVVM